MLSHISVVTTRQSTGRIILRMNELSSQKQKSNLGSTSDSIKVLSPVLYFIFHNAVRNPNSNFKCKLTVTLYCWKPISGILCHVNALMVETFQEQFKCLELVQEQFRCSRFGSRKICSRFSSGRK